MRVSTFAGAALLQTSLVWASPAHNVQTLAPRGGPSKRPNHAVAPYQTGGSPVYSPIRNRTCTVESKGNGEDDSENILSAINECNNGGHVVFAKDQDYTIGTALDLTFLKSIDLGQYTTSLVDAL
jgi:galacturan 1,4-alpha-galacturonidase